MKKNLLKRTLVTALVLGMAATSLAACKKISSSSGDGSSDGSSAAASFDTSKTINLYSREDGSGTRGAFIELFGIETKDADGNKTDNTSLSAVITNSTEVMLTSVAGDDYAIGYVSLGSLNDSVKAVKIDGAEATVDNIKAGTYKISRPFNIVTKGTLSDAAQDFYNFIFSTEGQKVITDNKYIAGSEDTKAFTSTNPTDKVVIAGSSSVTPVMEKLVEAYKAINTKANIEVQESDSTTGIQSTSEGLCDIGMASRDLKDTETGLTATVIATDGIAVIVNKNNTIDNLTTENVMNIYTDKATKWSDVAK